MGPENANWTVADTYTLADASGGDITGTLPTAVGIAGTTYTVKKIDATANAVVVEGDGTEEIDGALNVSITIPNTSLTFLSDGAGWRLV